MRRISVVGISGSGKSRLARELAGILGVPHVELDAIFHQAGWEPLADDEFRARVRAAAAPDGWVIDGAYHSRAGEAVWRRADTVIWFDLPRRTVMRRIILRTLRRNIARTELWNGNRERWRNLFSRDPEVSVIAWAWYGHARHRERYSAAARDPAYARLRFIRVASRADAQRILADAAGREESAGRHRLRQ